MEAVNRRPKKTGKRKRRLLFEALEERSLLSATTADLSQGALTANQSFVSNVYLDFLDRAVDPAGLAYFEGLLAAGLSRQQIVLQIEQTPEFARNEVEQLYERYLHREADSGSLSYYSNLLLGGATIERISADLAGSSEFFVSQGDGTNDGFLNAVYEDALGRPIDPAGLAWWTQVLAGGASRTQVAFQILSTQEYRHDVVEHAYLQLLFRQADPAGLQIWVGALNSGATDQMVYAGIASSDEYFNKQALKTPLAQWKDLGIVYAAPSGSAYYPSVVYDASGFGVGSDPFRMWYSNGEGGAFVTTSANGTTWSAPTSLDGLNNDPHHMQVLYDPAGFGGTSYKYKTWFWDLNAAGTPYTINSLAFAESTDGVHWVNEQPVTQNPAQPLVTGAETGWNRGSYGPINVHYQAGAANTGDDPWNYAYVMYYDGTDGSHEYTGLAYSTDGLFWSAYEPGPVLEGTPGAWDSYSVGYGTVIRRSADSFAYLYSGSTTSGVSQGIGLAISTDGIDWIKSPTNPIFDISQGVPYRSVRDYTPSVVQDNTGAVWMYYTAQGPNGTDPKDIGVARLLVAPTTPVDSDPAPNEVVEKAPTGTYVGLTAYSTDPEGGTITYSLTSDSSGGGFQIDPVTGRVTVDDGNKILYNANPSHTYQVTVQATATDGLTASQTFAIAVNTQNQAFIARVYLDFLGRPVDPSGLAYWNAQLAAGQSPQQVVFGVEQTPEYAQDTVNRIYQQYLRRNADPASLNYFSNLLLQGVTIEQISAAVAGSNEYFFAQGGGTIDGFLNALYQDALGRPIDPTALAFWKFSLAFGLTRTQVAFKVMSSQEYRQGVVEQGYQQLLGREADPMGLSAWLNLLNAGGTDQLVDSGIAGSQEYFEKAQT